MSSADNRINTELPVKDDDQQHRIPTLNMPLEGLLDVYRNTPALLQPFARPCSISGKTLSGEISEIELEVFAQGTTWVIETKTVNGYLFQGLACFSAKNRWKDWDDCLRFPLMAFCPLRLSLLKAGSATVIEHGRRWYLKQKGEIGIQSDPLQRSIESRLLRLEQKLEALNKVHN